MEAWCWRHFFAHFWNGFEGENSSDDNEDNIDDTTI